MIQIRLLCSNLFHLRDITLLVAGVDSEGLLREPVIVFPGEHDNELALLLDTLALLLALTEPRSPHMRRVSTTDTITTKSESSAEPDRNTRDSSRGR